MLDIDLTEIRKLERDLTKLYERALPFANRNFINDAAFDIRREAIKEIKEKLTLRNRWTAKSIQVERSRSLNLRKQDAAVGSTEEYMLDTEFGATERATGSKGITLATGWSAGQKGQQPRTRLPRKANAMRNIKLENKRAKGANRKQKNFLLVQQAVQTGSRYIFMDLGRRKGIFKVLGGRKAKEAREGKIAGARIKMVHDMTKKSVTIPATPWLTPATDRVTPKFPEMYKKRLIGQIRRANLFRR